MKLIPFAACHLSAAAELLAFRHRLARRAEPSLPSVYEDPQAALAVLNESWTKQGARGVAALQDGSLAGFLIGAPRIASVWGRAMWIDLGGHAVHPSQEAELYRDLYAALAPSFVAEGCFLHGAVMPNNREMLDAWFALSFGQEQVHAVLDLTSFVSEPGPAPEGLTFRKAGPEDLELIMSVAHLISHHQARSPVFAAALPENAYDYREGWTEVLADENSVTWLAFQGDQLAGFAMYEPAPPNLMQPERSVYLAVACTVLDLRGSGVGRALTAHGLRWAREAGYAHCVTDWRAANLLSSRFWPRRGFRPVACRLTRRIDERIAWARGPY